MTKPIFKPEQLQVVQMIALIRAEDLAEAWGYSGPNSAFRDFCSKMGVKHIPGRPGWFDPKHIRHRLDAVQGIGAQAAAAPTLSLVEQRKARNGKI